MPQQKPESEDHIFIKPENTVYPKQKGGGGGIPPVWIPHEDYEGHIERRKKGVNFLLNDVAIKNETKVLKDDMAYFVIDFKIKGDHPSCGTFLEKIQSRLLTFLDEEKTKVLVASAVDDLHSVTRLNYSSSMDKIIFDIRPMFAKEQIDKKIFTNEEWITNPKSIDIFLVPNIETERIQKYISQLKQFLNEQRIEATDSILDKYSSTGLITVKTNQTLTLKLLDAASFIFRVVETPKIDKESFYNNVTSNNNLTAYNPITQLQALPEVCVVDTGVNQIDPLKTIISTRSHDDNMIDDEDYDNHGTPVAYLAAYGEKNELRVRIISHKIVSGEVESNLFSAVARAVEKYRHRTRIFTCSITYRDDDDAANFETWKIDRLAQASNACILFSAGNIRPQELDRFNSLGLNYPTYLNNAPVMPPSNSPAVLCVGSYTLKTNYGTSIAPANSPSPFTRCRTRRNSIRNCVKPEVVEHGGNLNHNYSYNGIGVDTYSALGEPMQKIGTSFSTPVIAGHIAEIVRKYDKKIQNSETLKAILLSSCIPTENHPQYVGFGKPICSEMISSNSESVKIIFEGELRLSNVQLKNNVPANKIAIYVPSGVDRIELLLVHSDNYKIPSQVGLYTFVEVVPEKPARNTPPPPDIGDLTSRNHVKRLVWNYQKAARGVWFFWLVPHHIGIPFDQREKVIIRYGGVLKLTPSEPKSEGFLEEVRRNLKEHLYT